MNLPEPMKTLVLDSSLTYLHRMAHAVEHVLKEPTECQVHVAPFKKETRVIPAGTRGWVFRHPLHRYPGIEFGRNGELLPPKPVYYYGNGFTFVTAVEEDGSTFLADAWREIIFDRPKVAHNPKW